jgi:hypothetical protein
LTPHTVVNSAIHAFRSANSGFPPTGTGSGGSGYRGGARTYCLQVWLLTRIRQDRYRRGSNAHEQVVGTQRFGPTRGSEEPYSRLERLRASSPPMLSTVSGGTRVARA